MTNGTTQLGRAGLTLALLYRATVTVEPMIMVGMTPQGERRIVPIGGGHFEGPRLRGVVLPGGADWQLRRADGSLVLEARYTLRTDDEALIYVAVRGLRHGPPEILARLARGEEVDPEAYYFRLAPVYETGAPRYDWLNRVIAVGTAARRPSQVEMTVYAVE